MGRHDTVTVPAFEFKFNLVVFPLPEGTAKVSWILSIRNISILFVKDMSQFYVMSNNRIPPKRTGGTHWLEYLPGYAYCFVPSFDAFKGDPYVYRHVPDFVMEFSYYMEIEEVCKQNIYFYFNINVN